MLLNIPYTAQFVTYYYVRDTSVNIKEFGLHVFVIII